MCNFIFRYTTVLQTISYFLSVYTCFFRNSRLNYPFYLLKKFHDCTIKLTFTQLPKNCIQITNCENIKSYKIDVNFSLLQVCSCSMRRRTWEKEAPDFCSSNFSFSYTYMSLRSWSGLISLLSMRCSSVPECQIKDLKTIVWWWWWWLVALVLFIFCGWLVWFCLFSLFVCLVLF